MTIDPMFLSGAAAAVLLAFLGSGFSRMIFGDGAPQPTTGWREIWRRTMWLHPVIGGAIIAGWVPGPDVLPGVAGAVIWYGAWGALALPVYRVIESFLHRSQGGPT